MKVYYPWVRAVQYPYMFREEEHKEVEAICQDCATANGMGAKRELWEDLPGPTSEVREFIRKRST